MSLSDKVILQFHNDTSTATDRARVRVMFTFVEAVFEQLQPVAENLQELVDVSVHAEELATLTPYVTEFLAIHGQLATFIDLHDNLTKFTDLHGALAAINDVHAALAVLNAVHGKLTEIQTVADNDANVTIVADNIANIIKAADNVDVLAEKANLDDPRFTRRDIVSLGTGSDRAPVDDEIVLTGDDFNKVISLRPQGEAFTVIIPDGSVDHKGKPISIEYGKDSTGYVTVKTATTQKIGRHDELFFSRNAESVKIVADTDKYILEGDAGLFNPAVVVNSEYQMDAAVEKLNRLIGGGNITIATGFTLTEDKDWNLGKILLVGDGGANTAITSGGFKITVRGGLYAQAVRFVGQVAETVEGSGVTNDGSTFIRLLADTDNPVCQATFNMCMFRDLVGTVDTTPHIQIQNEGSGNSWNVRIQACDAVTPGITGVTGLIFELGATLGFLNMYVNLQARADGYEKVVVRGTEPSGGAKLFSTDGSATMVSTFMVYTEILPFATKANLAGGNEFSGVQNFLEMIQVDGEPVSYLEEHDIWVLTTNFSGSADPITTNLARSTILGFEKIGAGMSESSGVFSFPSTGKWEITLFVSVKLSADEQEKFLIAIIRTTINDLDYSQTGRGASSIHKSPDTIYQSAIATLAFNVTDISNQKLKIGVFTGNANTEIEGGTSTPRTYATFKKYAQ